MDRLGSRCPLPGYSRPSVLICFLILATSFLMYPMLRTLSLQLHSAITGSYISGTHSIVFVNCPNEQIARDIARGILDKKLAASVNILPKTSSLCKATFSSQWDSHGQDTDSNPCCHLNSPRSWKHPQALPSF
uniref:protein CutA homolog isoform X3 n=1 Tax=Urocitellus parryii TaxID=9999 RepID=UPI000E560A1D|nr:protein CutA homolog isoform X3 [Urocitellus parryii]